MITIITILGLLYFVDNLFIKFEVWDWFMKKSMKSRFEIIYKLTCCRFCMMFHMSWILTLIYGAITGFYFDLVFVPFVVSGLTRLIEKV